MRGKERDLGSMVSKKDILRIVLAGIGLTSVAALIYLAGPLISIGGWHPFQNYIVREMAILLLAAVFAAVVSAQIFKRKKASAKLADGIADTRQSRRRHRRPERSDEGRPGDSQGPPAAEKKTSSTICPGTS